jgi:hypothetical protein
MTHKRHRSRGGAFPLLTGRDLYKKLNFNFIRDIAPIA